MARNQAIDGDIDDLETGAPEGPFVKRGDLQTHFADSVVETPDVGGTWGGIKNGDTSFQGAQKGVSGKVPEMTYPDIAGMKPNDKPKESAGGKVANKKGREHF